MRRRETSRSRRGASGFPRPARIARRSTCRSSGERRGEEGYPPPATDSTSAGRPTGPGVSTPSGSLIGRAGWPGLRTVDGSREESWQKSSARHVLAGRTSCQTEDAASMNPDPPQRRVHDPGANRHGTGMSCWRYSKGRLPSGVAINLQRSESFQDLTVEDERVPRGLRFDLCPDQPTE